MVAVVVSVAAMILNSNSHNNVNIAETMTTMTTHGQPVSQDVLEISFGKDFVISKIRGMKRQTDGSALGY
jgi:Zn-dependent membrane protease YugP